MDRIYFDNNATTPLDPRVLKAMLVDLEGPPANPSSIHWFGQRAKNLLAQARATVAAFFQAKPEEILFTSGGTESLNTLLHSVKGHLITTAIEHSSIYRTAQTLGLDATYLPVGLWGAPLPEQIKAAIRPDTRAILLSAANGETGVKLDLTAVADLALQRGIPLFIDAVASIGKEPFPHHPGIAAIACSGHKFHAPKGVGCLFTRRSLKLSPLLIGGGQESSKRAGTENLAGILGLAEALKILMEQQSDIAQHLLDLRSRFETGLKTAIPDLLICGEGPRIANTSTLAFPNVSGETLLLQLDLAGIAASHGSACSSGALEPSRVLLNMGLDRKTALSALRFSFSRMNTRDEIARAVSLIADLVKKLRGPTRA